MRETYVRQFMNDPCMTIFYPESRFGGFTDIDGTIAFYVRLQELLKPESSVLDIGCGRGAFQNDTVRIRRQLRALKGKVRHVLGIDVDKEAGSNPHVDEFRLIEGIPWPVEDGSIDLCLSDSVLEHVENPEVFFAECNRVLKPGGFLCMRTTNKWGYVGMLARLIPNSIHAQVLRLAQPSRKEKDVFPTRYACNSPWIIKRFLSRHSFEGVVYGYDSEPKYLSFSRIAYFFGVLHQKFAPSILKGTLFVFATKT